MRSLASLVVFFFNATPPTEIYTLSLHDALPILTRFRIDNDLFRRIPFDLMLRYQFIPEAQQDRKSTRLNSSHSQISYAVFCLKKKTYAAHARRSAPRAAFRARTRNRVLRQDLRA